LSRHLILPVAASGLMHVVLAAGDRLPAVDTLAYFETGRNLVGGNGYTRFGPPELHFPPLVPVGLGVLERVTGGEMAALRSWNVFWGLAVMASLVGLAHKLWRDDGVTVVVAWLGGTVSGLSPLFFRHGSGSEAVSLALLLTAALLALVGLEQWSDSNRARAAWLLRFGGSGLLVALAYLARPEALLPGLLIGLAVAIQTWRRRGFDAGRVRATATATATGAFCLGVAVLVAPYVAYLHSHTGSWSLTAKSQDVSIEAWRAVAENDRRARDQILYALGPDGTRMSAEIRPLAELAVERPAAWLGIVGVNASKMAESYLAPLWGYGPAWTLLPAPLLVPALLALWQERRRRSTWLLAGMALISLATSLAFFTLARYLVLPTAVLILFVAKGLVGWHRELPRRWAGSLAVAVALLVAMSTLTEARSFLPGQPTADPIVQVEVGRWLERNTAPGSRVMTRSFHVQAYANRPIVAMPASDYPSMLRFARRMGVRYVVADRRSQPYDVLMLGPPPPHLRLVVVLGTPHRPVRVYRLDPPAPPSDEPPFPLGYVGD
jgi:hypothetical protein